VLLRREETIGYPTDFAAMSDVWIDRLSARGEELTRCLITQYMPEVITMMACLTIDKTPGGAISARL
jgi:hypothetical protein